MAARGHPAVPRYAWAFLVLVPVSLVAWALRIGSVPVFVVAAAAVIPLAYVMGVATEELGKHAGPGVGGLLNATFGNATELIIALVALSSGLVTVVKASITGSIVGNILLVLGASMLTGGVRHKKQTFNRAAAGLQVTMLTLAVVGLVMPELYSLFIPPATPPSPPSPKLDQMSLIISVILLVAYLAGLLFSFHTHKDVFNPVTREGDPPRWGVRLALGVLLGATALVALESEVLVGALEGAIAETGLTELFAGVVVIAIVGNAAEHSASILLAWRNKMDLSVGIATSSSTQIALFVAPVLVLVSTVVGPRLMTLDFEPFELVSIALSVAILSLCASDGESNWYEGALLIMVYAIIAVGFFFHP
ncbi:MAG: calcium/proton exchanger [Euryarchaeota archaeon RBG_16_68_12]|nr:MAG: calcium/proton exchanger [Euryarchaeota archaeon RBG_16_68_12]